jgi:hypothetical protein
MSEEKLHLFRSYEDDGEKISELDEDINPKEEEEKKDEEEDEEDELDENIE